jgi:macrophage erythroblast attacher
MKPSSQVGGRTVQAGLAALKTSQSLADDGNREDPLHLASFRALAQPLPFAKHVHSKLVCSITREIMNEDNPPLVTPDGNVYSERGVKANAAQHGGMFVCPTTGAAKTC